MSQPSKSLYIVEIANQGQVAVRRQYSDGRVVFGRSRTKAHLAIPDRMMSARHGELRFKNGKVRVKDLGSTNGTFWNGARRAESFELKAGDRFMAGQVCVKLVEIAPVRAAAAKKSSPALDGSVPVLTRVPTPQPMKRPAEVTQRISRRKHHATKLLVIAGAIAGIAALFMPFTTVNLDMIGLGDAQPQLTLLGALDGAGFQADASASTDFAARGADNGIRSAVNLAAVAYASAACLLLIGLSGLFTRFGRGLGGAALTTALFGGTALVMLTTFFGRVPFMTAGTALLVLAIGLAVSGFGGMVALLVPEPAARKSDPGQGAPPRVSSSNMAGDVSA